MFVFTFLGKIKEKRLKLSRGSVTVLQKIAIYEEARVELTNTPKRKLKSEAKIRLEPN